MRKLYSKEVVSKDVYKRVRDRESRDTCEERLEKILEDIEDRTKRDANVLLIFLCVLIDLNRKDLADIINTKYKGILHYIVLSQFIFYFIFLRTREKSVKAEQLKDSSLQRHITMDIHRCNQ